MAADLPGRVRTAHGTAEILGDADRDGSWVLLVDDTPQSHVDLDDPTHLEFEYVRRMGNVPDLAAEEGRPLDVVHLGGGALTLPRYVAATRPGSRQRVMELDEPLTGLVRSHLPLPRDARIRVRTADARAGLADPPDPGAARVAHALHRISTGYAVAGLAVPVFGVATAVQLGVLRQAWLLIAAALILLVSRWEGCALCRTSGHLARAPTCRYSSPPDVWRWCRARAREPFRQREGERRWP